MPRISISSFLNDVVDQNQTRKKWGRWNATIEGGLNEDPRAAFEETLKRIIAIIEHTGDAKNIPMHAPNQGTPINPPEEGVAGEIMSGLDIERSL
jgi:hypothetical protein